MQNLTTARLLLRPLTLADAAGMFELDTDPAVHRYLGGIGGPRPASLADSEATIRFIEAQYATHGIGRWAVALGATGEFMGWAGLKLVTEPVNGQRDFYDIGYRFIPRLGAGLRLRGRAGVAALRLCDVGAAAHLRLRRREQRWLAPHSN